MHITLVATITTHAFLDEFKLSLRNTPFLFLPMIKNSSRIEMDCADHGTPYRRVIPIPAKVPPNPPSPFGESKSSDAMFTDPVIMIYILRILKNVSF